MNIQLANRIKLLGGVAALTLCAALQGNAQGFGGFIGGGAQNRQASTTSTTTTYNPAGDVGNATVMVDPDTHNLIIDADDATTKAGPPIRNSRRPVRRTSAAHRSSG